MRKMQRNWFGRLFTDTGEHAIFSLCARVLCICVSMLPSVVRCTTGPRWPGVCLHGQIWVTWIFFSRLPLRIQRWGLHMNPSALPNKYFAYVCHDFGTKAGLQARQSGQLPWGARPPGAPKAPGLLSVKMSWFNWNFVLGYVLLKHHFHDKRPCVHLVLRPLFISVSCFWAGYS